MRNNYKTDETFVSVDGKTVRLEDVLQGAVEYVNRLLSKRFISEAQANDLVQDAAIRILRSSKRYDTRKASNPGAYGWKVAKSLYNDSWKSESRLGEAVEYDQALENTLPDAGLADDWATSEEVEDLRESFISALSGDNRTAMRMSLNGAMPEAIAEELGCTPGAAAIRCCKLRKKFQVYLHNNGYCSRFYREAV